LLDFYRCVHAFKGVCSLMGTRLTLAKSIASRLHDLEGRLAVKDHWTQAPQWLPEFEKVLQHIQLDLYEASRVRGTSAVPGTENPALGQASSPVPSSEGALGSGSVLSLGSGSGSGSGNPDKTPVSVKVLSGGRELVFPWARILEFVPGRQVRHRPVVPVQGRLLAVVPSQGAAHEQEVFLGIAVSTQLGQSIVVPVQTLELVY
jgi:hypothetical protein